MKSVRKERDKLKEKEVEVKRKKMEKEEESKGEKRKRRERNCFNPPIPIRQTTDTKRYRFQYRLNIWKFM